MTWEAVLLVTAVVWAISLIRSVRLRAFVYSLPLPMTLALLTTGFRVDGAQIVGVIGLNLFFLAVAVLYHRFGWPIVLADLAGIAVYVALSAALLAAPVPFLPALVGTVGLWLVVMLALRHRPGLRAGAEDSPVSGVPTPRRDEPPAPAQRQRAVPATVREGLPAPVKLVVIFAGAVLTALFGHLLRGMVVTFPYSGVLTAIETRRSLPEFSRHFARNSLALVAFLSAYRLWQDGSPGVALVAGWLAFGGCALALHAPGWWAARTVSRRRSAGNDGSGAVGQTGPAGARFEVRGAAGVRADRLVPGAGGAAGEHGHVEGRMG